jgi:hypothetical protein
MKQKFARLAAVAVMAAVIGWTGYFATDEKQPADPAAEAALTDATARIEGAVTPLIGYVFGLLTAGIVAQIPGKGNQGEKGQGGGTGGTAAALLALACAGCLVMPSCVTTETTDAKGATVRRTDFNPPPELWQVIGNAVARQAAVDAQSGK